MDGLVDYLQGGGILGYTYGGQPYIDAVTGWMKRRHGWDVNPDWMCDSPGIVPAFFAAVRALTAPGDGVIVNTPAYYPFYLAMERTGRRLVRNPLVIVDGEYRIDFDLLEEQAKDPATKVLLFCSPHNPTGRVWREDELTEVARIAVENDLVVISDEIHFDLVMPGNKHTVLASLNDEIARRTITCTAPSKTFNLAGMATSSIIISDEELRETFTTELHAQGFFSLNTLGYLACELAYTRAEPWLEGLLELVDTNRRVLREFMAEHLPEVVVHDLQGTYLQWMDFRPLGFAVEELERLMTQEAFVFFDEGYIFGDEEGGGFERMNIACPTRTMLDALERVVATVNAHRSKP